MVEVLAGTLDPFDPFVAGLCDDPYPTYARYREADPVHWVPAESGHGGRWAVFRHADVNRVLRCPAFGRGERGAARAVPVPERHAAYFRMISRWMLFSDRPEHTRRRAAFTEALARLDGPGLRRRVEAIAEPLVDGLPAGRPFDLIADFAFTLPVLVVADLVGLPEADRDRLRVWSTKLAAAIGVDRRTSVLEDAERTAREMHAYLHALLAERRRRPADDLLSALAADADPGDAELREEIVANCAFLVLAGHETTTHLIASGMLSLQRHRGELERLRRRPEIVVQAVEELLRFESPVQITSRTVQEDVEIGGRRMRTGDRVDVVLGAANRDPDVFVEPERLDLERCPNPHVAFGAGGHYCLGATLARLEGAVALPLLVRRFPGLRIVEPDLRWRANAAFRGVERLLVTG